MTSRNTRPTPTEPAAPVANRGSVQDGEVLLVDTLCRRYGLKKHTPASTAQSRTEDGAVRIEGFHDRQMVPRNARATGQTAAGGTIERRTVRQEQSVRRRKEVHWHRTATSCFSNFTHFLKG